MKASSLLWNEHLGAIAKAKANAEIDYQNQMKEYKMQHEKKKLTRKEAIEIFSKHMPDVRNASKTIDFYIEAGMLEIVEEKQQDTIIIKLPDPIDGSDYIMVLVKDVKDALTKYKITL